MRAITAKERVKAGNLYCSFCRPKKVQAVYRREGSHCHSTGFACSEHTYKLEKSSVPEHFTCADEQTWMRL